MDRLPSDPGPCGPEAGDNGAFAKLSFISWNPGWETGIPEIDREHKAMVAVLETLVAALAEGREAEEIRGTLETISRYIQDHFNAEEALMTATSYPGIALHREAHERLRIRLARIAHQGRSEPRGLPMELVGFLVGWFQDHLTGEDQRMVLHLKTWGPQTPGTSGSVPCP